MELYFENRLSPYVLESHELRLGIFGDFSDFIVERAIHVCLEDFQDTAAPPRVNMYPLVDFNSSESAIQLASLSSSTGGYSPYLKAYSLVCDT